MIDFLSQNIYLLIVIIIGVIFLIILAKFLQSKKTKKGAYEMDNINPVYFTQQHSESFDNSNNTNLNNLNDSSVKQMNTVNNGFDGNSNNAYSNTNTNFDSNEIYKSDNPNGPDVYDNYINKILNESQSKENEVK